MPSLPTLGNLWRRLRNPDGSGKSTSPSRQDRARFAEVSAAATTDRIRRVVQATRVPPESPEETPADTSTRSPESSPSSAGPQRSTRQLWGREFSVTEGGGLSPEQVTEFVEELLARNRSLEEQGIPAAMSNYVQKLMGELQNVEESIQSQARRDAEAQAARITVDASRKAQETITRARTEATEMAQREAEGILAQARKKAEIADGQIRIQAQLMLGKVREQIEARIQQEGETAYNRLLASLTNLNQEIQRIESEWKQARAQLWRGDDVKLALGATGLSALPIIQEALSSTAGEATPAPDATLPQAEPSETSEEAPILEMDEVTKKPSMVGK